MIDLKRLDTVTKILLIFLAGIAAYFVIFLFLKPFFIVNATQIRGMMGYNMMNFSSDNLIFMNLFALMFVAIVAVLISFYLFNNNANELNILKKALSDDEKAVLDEVNKAGEITQDSLRFRLNWSKAKISTILTNLD